MPHKFAIRYRSIQFLAFFFAEIFEICNKRCQVCASIVSGFGLEIFKQLISDTQHVPMPQMAMLSQIFVKEITKHD